MNFFERLKLKFFSENWEEYGYLKYARMAASRLEAYEPPVNAFSLIPGKTVKVKHSGNSGDIIYSLPFVKGIANGNGVDFFLHLDQPANYDRAIAHPLGNVMLNQRMMNMLKPLFDAQPWISKCGPYTDQHIDINLDEVRNAAIPFDKVCLPRWYFLVFGIHFDLSEPWLEALPDTSTKDCILLARSSRYHGYKVDYSILKKYPKIHFIGIEEEYNEMKLMLPHLEYRPVRDFLEMASLIAGAKLFIGNQSFPFSLAEALKVNRLLEVSMYTPDVSVNGKNGYEFYYQQHFASLVKKRYEL
jgi:hypothetical protein